MRKTLLSLLAVAVLLSTSSTCPAQESPAGGLKPVLAISFAGYDALFGDIEYIGKLGGNARMAQGLEAVLTLMTQGQGLAGLDKTKPWGAVVQTDGVGEFSVLGFVPVTDLSALLGVLKTQNVDVKDAGGGTHEIGSEWLYAKQQNGWAFLSNTAEALADVPADPLKLLGGLNEKYDLAVRASVQNVPAPMRQMYLEMLKAGAQAGMVQMPGESDEDYAARTGITKRGIDQFVTMANDLDGVLMGFAVDQSAGTSFLDIEVTAVAGSDTAAQFAEIREGKTSYAGFDLPGAAATANFAGTLSDADVAQAKDSIAQVRSATLKELKNQGLSGGELQVATQLMGDLFDVLEKTVEKKEADGGAVLLLNPGALTFVAGGAIADGAKLESILKRLAAEAEKEEPGIAELLKLDAETHEGVSFHTLDLPMDDPNGAKVFGDTLNVVAGISQTSAYLGVGPAAVATLKQVIDKSKAEAGKAIPPMRIVVALTPVLKFAAEIAEDTDKMMPAMLAGVLEQSGGKDHITLTSKAIPNGASVRVEIEEGILKVIGQAGQMAQQMMGPGGPGGEAPAGDNPF